MSLKIIHGWSDLDAGDRGAALALGNFDGVHRGHRAVIAEAAKIARKSGAPLGVVSFDPHPRRFFKPDSEPFRIMTLNQQGRALADLGVDRLHILRFDAEMAGMSDEAFARDVLAAGLGAQHVAAGFDVTFGKGRTGSAERLKGFGDQFGFTVSICPEVGDDGGRRLSSSAVREALQTGRPELAAEILGRPFAIEGVVQHGDKRGRELGMPTANVALSDYLRPAYGVYATRTVLPDGREVPGVANLGVRPMFATPDPLLEVWLFDFDEDLYGQLIETQLIAYLRPEMRFEGLEPLMAQMQSDAEAARAILSL